MKIGGFQKLTLLDYPGQVACIVFTKGCNFRCPFCHNAGLVLPGEDDTNETEDSILSYLSKRRNVLDGVVFTGGEPLLQPDLEIFLRKVRALDYKIKLDTNGSFPKRLKTLLDFGLVDYVAMDIKQAPEKYETASGISGREVVPLVEQSLNALYDSGIPFELRTTVVKGIHTVEDLTMLAKWIACCVPYYLQSYVDSGHVISPTGLCSFSEKELEEMLSMVRTDCPSAALRI